MIDPKLQAELRAKFNPDGSDLRKLQLRMLDMLKYIDRICKENNITYWLSSGTCLGAVRHGGFIPWDDDVDIELLDKDYEKLIEALSNNKQSKYQVQSRKTDVNFKYPYAKLRDESTKIIEIHGDDQKYNYHGIFIDIFPMRKSNSIFIHPLGTFVYCRENILNNKSSLVNKLIHKNCMYFYKLLKFLSSIHANGRLRHEFGMGFYKPRNLMDIFPIKYAKFEDTLLPIPGNNDNYLEKIFGDYTKLPDMESIKTHITKVVGL